MITGRRKVVRYGLIASNVAFFVLVGAFILSTRNAAPAADPSQLNLAADQQIVSPLDGLSSADIAVNVAYMAGMPEAVAVVNHADSASAQGEVLSGGSNAVSKPQIVRTNLKSKSDIVQYTVVEGDTIASIAQQFGISSKSIEWSNDVTDASLTAGNTIVIPPVDGIVYTVASGDTASALASKYRSDESRIVAFNDAELSGLVEGEQIVIPDGEIVPPPRPVYATAANFSAVYGPGNGYDRGWCTWHAANRRLESGRPLPRNLGNAVTWSPRARAAGFTVSDTPVAGAVIWHDQSQSGYVAGGLGHVAYVESVNPDGSIIVSDMNSRGFVNADATGAPAGGWGRISYRRVAPSEFHKYDFIH